MILIASQLFICFFFIPVLSSGVDTLAVNQSLSGNQTLVSLDESFEMGFFRPGESPNYYIGIWYKRTPETVVWVANRDTPVYDRFSSELKIIHGNLVLLDESDNHIWSTNMNSTATTASVVLLDDGNLVLRYGSNISSLPIWQSFDHLTHTFLPGSKLGYDKRANTNRILTSWRNKEDPGVGLYSLEFDQNQRQIVIKWNRSIQYWISGPWNIQTQTFSEAPVLRLNHLYKFRYIDNKNESYFTYCLNRDATISKFVISIRGLIQLETYRNKQWSPVLTQPQQNCLVYGMCGSSSVCYQRMYPSCNCLTGFEPRSLRDWYLDSYSGGCVRKTAVDSCSVVIEKPVFILRYVEERFIYAFPPNDMLQIDESTCRRSCLDDCGCNGYAVDSVCRQWKRKNLSTQSLEFVSNDSYIRRSQLYIKIALKDLPHRTKNKKINQGAVVGSVVSVVFILGVILLIICRKKRRLIGKPTKEGTLVAFVYRDLRKITGNFSHKLGGGSFGSVFKGVLDDSTLVAVKKLESVSQGEKEFRNEVSTLGIIQPVNLVRLYGFCAQGKNRLLVYDYMPNGSLNSYLFNAKENNPLSWNMRYQIALGIAKGLVYLHEKCRDCIIHCDIKPENILLDADFCPKIADFGLAKLVGKDFSRVLTTMRGTRGYLAPEWLSGMAVTMKAYVFSYGVMLFELVSGKRNSHQSEDKSFTFFPSLAANVLMAGGDILSLLDSRLNREASVEEVSKIFKVAYWCIQDEEDNRPSMSEVERILEGVLDVNMPPMPQYVKYFVDEVEDFLFFKQFSSIKIQMHNAKSPDSHSESKSASL